MAIYLVKFKNIPEYVKVGRSKDTKSRIKSQIADNGALSFVIEFATPEGVSDEVTERMILDTYRQKLSKASSEITMIKGWTEFLANDNTAVVISAITELGYLPTSLGLKDFKGITAGHPFDSRIRDMHKMIRELQVVDAAILTAYVAGEPFPKSLAEFESLCERSGTETGWCSEFTFRAASELHARFPEGVIR